MCCVSVAVVSAAASKAPPPNGAGAADGFKTSRQRPHSSHRRLLQQNLPIGDITSSATLGTKIGKVVWRAAQHNDHGTSPKAQLLLSIARSRAFVFRNHRYAPGVAHVARGGTRFLFLIICSYECLRATLSCSWIARNIYIHPGYRLACTCLNEARCKN